MPRPDDLSEQLSEAFKIAFLNEGLFDSITKLISSLDDKWTEASSSIDKSNVVVVPPEIKPKENIEDQLMATTCISQLVGYAVEGIARELSYYNEIAGNFEDSARDEEDFANDYSYLMEIIARMTGEAAGWLQDKELELCSPKIYAVGQKLQPTEKSADSVSDLISVLETLNEMDIPGQIKKILDQDEVIAMIAGEHSYFGDTIKETVKPIESIEEVLAALIPMPEHIENIELLMKEKLKTSEVAGQEDPVNVDMT